MKIMGRKKTVLSLTSVTTKLLAQMTKNAFRKFFDADYADSVYHRECKLSLKRKRSSSCDGEQGILMKRVKTSVTGTESIPLSKKRKVHESEDYANYKMKYPRLESEENTIPQINDLDNSHEIQDDITVNYYSNDNQFDILKRYFRTLPTPCWDQYSDSLLKWVIRDIKTNVVHLDSLEKVVEYIACAKLQQFSTKSADSFENMKDAFYKQLKCCRNLRSLEITIAPKDDTQVIQTSMALQRLRNLQSLYLVPNSKYSYHWIFDGLSRCCQRLRELKVVYDGDNFLENEGISVLKNCCDLRAVWFFNYGRKSETKSLTELLKTLISAKIIFHKELPNAILELTGGSSNNSDDYSIQDQPATNLCCLDSIDYTVTRKGESTPFTLSLERVDLCWYQPCIGYQLVYIPASYLSRVVETCPRISLINLIGSTCLLQILIKLPNLQAIVLQQTSFALSMRCALKNIQFERLTVLRVSDVWDITYDMFSSLADSCKNLQVLSISCSSLEARGRLIQPRRKPSFNKLQHLTLVPGTLNERPSLTSPAHWELGADLTKFILHDATNLSAIHLQYKQDDLTFEDMPTEMVLEEVLCISRPSLESLVLEWPPAISRNFVSKLVGACPELTKLGSLTTWPLTNDECASLITTFSSFFDIS